MKRETCENCTTCCAHQTNGLLWSIDHTNNHQKIVVHFSKLKWLHHQPTQTCSKTKSSSSIVIGFVDSLIGFKWLYTCNKWGHKIFASYFATNSTAIELS